jgi:AraC family transcriptional regulator
VWIDPAASGHLRWLIVSASAVELGTVSARRQRVGTSEISAVVFGPEVRLSWHHHPRSCLAVVIDGAIRKVFPRTEEDAVDGTVIEMPAEERHEDLFGRDGARIVVLESEERSGALRCFRDWKATMLAHDVSRELEHPDAYTQLSLEGLALELTATVARLRDRPRHEPRLALVDAMLADRIAHPPSLSEIAHEVGVHPSHLARMFRAHYGESVGEHGRRLRLGWAAQRVARSVEPLAEIAARAGFADQSHFTREFKRYFGITPGRYRSAHR